MQMIDFVMTSVFGANQIHDQIQVKVSEDRRRPAAEAAILLIAHYILIFLLNYFGLTFNPFIYASFGHVFSNSELHSLSFGLYI